MAFPFQKIRRAVGGRRMLFPLSPVWDGTSCRHVAMPACRDDVMSAYVIQIGLPCHFPTDLLTGVKALKC